MIVYDNETRSFGFGQSITNWGKKNSTSLITSGITSAAGAYIGRKRAQRKALNAGFERGSAEYNRMVRKGTIRGGAVGAVGGFALGNRINAAHKYTKPGIDISRNAEGKVSLKDRWDATKIGIKGAATFKNPWNSPNHTNPANNKPGFIRNTMNKISTAWNKPR